MLTCTNISPEWSVHYYDVGDDLTESERKWVTHGAEEIGLVGTVIDEDLRSVLFGRSPSGEKLRRGANTRGSEFRRKTPYYSKGKNTMVRAAVDCTLSAPKSISLTALVHNDGRLLDAHRQAVLEVAKQIEKKHIYTRIRTNGQYITEQTDNCIGATVLHKTNRSNDPQLHTHLLICNSSRASDGKRRAIVNTPFFKDHRRELGHLYQMELARQCQELGYKVKWKGNHTFDIVGYTLDQINAFSQRNTQIQNLKGS